MVISEMMRYDRRMDSYPSFRTVPSPAAERLLFGFWIATSLLLVAFFVIEAVRHPAEVKDLFGVTGFALMWSGLFGAAGVTFRRRRLQRQAAREKFLTSIANSI
jgi:hypothetical protein